ncbi:Hypothetical_protein [Hexamita inflata]|uniref:Hypothetical_protein n=1 Tax=Hexamita inflata TaxID=28002 RepID=A0AA86NYU7_9EUKA|nr:Hypothetical protein HINF_LOCUS15951 [Hexamita inflata]
MASVLITRRTGCLGGGICDDRIRSAQTYFRSSRSGFDFWASLGGSSTGVAGALFIRRTARRTWARHRRSLRLADAFNGAGRSATVRVMMGGRSAFAGVRVHCCPLFRRRFQIHGRAANRSWPVDSKTAGRTRLFSLENSRQKVSASRRI